MPIDTCVASNQVDLIFFIIPVCYFCRSTGGCSSPFGKGTYIFMRSEVNYSYYCSTLNMEVCNALNETLDSNTALDSTHYLASVLYNGITMTLLQNTTTHIFMTYN